MIIGHKGNTRCDGAEPPSDRQSQPRGPDPARPSTARKRPAARSDPQNKGRLVLTAAKRLLDDPAGLWLFLARAIAPRHRHDSERDATLLLLLEVAAGKRTEWADYLEAVSFGLGALGWSTRTGAELEPNTVQALLVDAQEVLLNLGIFDDRFGPKANTAKASGQAFARAALHS